jgi:hypothetical protein
LLLTTDPDAAGQALREFATVVQQQWLPGAARTLSFGWQWVNGMGQQLLDSAENVFERTLQSLGAESALTVGRDLSRLGVSPLLDLGEALGAKWGAARSPKNGAADRALLEAAYARLLAGWEGAGQVIAGLGVINYRRGPLGNP